MGPTCAGWGREGPTYAAVLARPARSVRGYPFRRMDLPLGFLSPFIYFGEGLGLEKKRKKKEGSGERGIWPRSGGGSLCNRTGPFGAFLGQTPPPYPLLYLLSERLR